MNIFNRTFSPSKHRVGAFSSGLLERSIITEIIATSLNRIVEKTLFSLLICQVRWWQVLFLLTFLRSANNLTLVSHITFIFS